MNWEIKYYTEVGKYYGYPACCIKAFCEQGINKTVAQFKVAAKTGFTGFVPCPKHSVKILEGKITLVSLIKNRKCPTPFPKEGKQKVFDAFVKTLI